MQPNNIEKNEKKPLPKLAKRSVKDKLIHFNKSVSKEIDKAADTIDKNVSPHSPGIVEKNKTQIYFITGGDFSDDGDIKSNFRYGAQLNLPRFEKYWKLKFANQDEKRDRGQSAVTRSQRTRNTNDDIFVGVDFTRHWNRIDVDYRPQIAIHKGIGLDHSVEAGTKYEIGNFDFKPTLEFFANHDEGTGSSTAIQFLYWFFSDSVALEQTNDARFVYLSHILAVNHSIGILYTPTDRWKLATRYFRSYANDLGYRLSAYGVYIDSNYEIYRKILFIQMKPYFVYELADNFKEVRGILINFKITF